MRFLLPIMFAAQVGAVTGMSADPFDIFRPAIELRPSERQALDRGTPLIYWSKERLGEKTVISATHVVLVEPESDSSVEMLVVGIQIFATHYLDAALEITGVVRNADWSQRYLVHIYRAEVDLLDGLWGGLARSAIASRIRKDGPPMLETARYRLSAVDPPSP